MVLAKNAQQPQIVKIWQYLNELLTIIKPGGFDGVCEYPPECSDEKVAGVMGVKKASVMGVRRSCFGTLHKPPRSPRGDQRATMKELKKTLADVEARVAKLEARVVHLEHPHDWDANFPTLPPRRGTIS